MSHHSGPLATASNKFTQLQTCNNRIRRNLDAIGTRDDPDIHSKIDTDRHQSLKLCLEVKDLLEKCPKNQQRTHLATQLQSEMSRFESLSKELQSKDIHLNKSSAQQAKAAPKKDIKKANKNVPNSMNDYDPLLADDEDEQLQQQEQLAAQLLLTEEQDASIDIDQMQRRKEEIKQIESDVQKLATMFQDLQQMVYEQGEQLDVIEENIIQTETNTSDAYTQLTEAEEHQIASSRSLKYLMLIGVVALVAVVITAIVLYVNHQKKKP